MSGLLLIDALLDEDTDKRLAGPLEEQGHNIERVVDVRDLGPGTDDADVFEYAEREDRIIVTYDEGFFQRVNGTNGPLRLLWFTDQQRYRPDQEAEMIKTVLQTIPDRDSAPRALPVTPAYLD